MNMIIDFKVGISYPVHVTHVNGPHNFYVRSSNVSDFMVAIEKPGSAMPAKTIQYGQRVVFKSNILGKYVRGEVRYINTDGKNAEFDIFAIDYGCYENSILLGCIYSLDCKAEPENQCPPLAVHCRLYLCEPRGEAFTEDVIDAMKSYCSEHTAHITIKNRLNNQLVVELRTVECPRDISTMLGLIDLTTYTKGYNTVNRFYNSAAIEGSASSALNLTETLNYEHKQLKVGDTLHVRVQGGTSVADFYVAEVNEYKKLVYSQPGFAMYCRDRQMQDKDIVPGIPCAVKVGTPPMYERAIVKEINSEKALLSLVDCGKDIESSFLNIKSVLSEIYYTQPIVALYCSTDEDQVWDNGLPKFLFPGYQLVIKIMEVGNGFAQPHKVNIYPCKM